MRQGPARLAPPRSCSRRPSRPPARRSSTSRWSPHHTRDSRHRSAFGAARASRAPRPRTHTPRPIPGLSLRPSGGPGPTRATPAASGRQSGMPPCPPPSLPSLSSSHSPARRPPYPPDPSESELGGATFVLWPPAPDGVDSSADNPWLTGAAVGRSSGGSDGEPAGSEPEAAETGGTESSAPLAPGFGRHELP